MDMFGTSGQPCARLCLTMNGSGLAGGLANLATLDGVFGMSYLILYLPPALG